MSIPTYQDFMLPLLRLLNDGQDHTLGELRQHLAEEFTLTEDERNLLLPSKRQLTWHNRIHWAKTYLQAAGLVESPSRGKVRITSQGQTVLKSGIDRIDDAYLFQFPGFTAFKGRTPGVKKETPSLNVVPQPEATPDESIEDLYRNLRETLASELIAQIMECSPGFFERLVVELLVSMGYGGTVQDAGQAIGKTGDDGIDGIIKQDRLGLDNIYIQAKRWKNSVGGPEIRNFAGSLAFHKASKGVFITTSTFTGNATQTAKQLGNIVLIDGDTLAEYMMDYSVGVTTVASYEVKRIDRDYFDEL